MTIQLDGSSAYLRHDYPSARGYPKSLGGWFKVTGATSGFAISSTKTDTAGGTIAAWLADNSNALYNYRQTSAGGDSDNLGSEIAQYRAAGLTYLLVVATDDSTHTIFTPSYPSGRTFNPASDVPADIAALASFVLGCYYRNGSRSLYFTGHMAEVAEWGSSLTAANYASLAGGAQPETISPGTLYDAWDLQTAASSYTGLLNGKVLTAFGGISTSAVAHPVTRASGPALSSPTITGVGTTTATPGISTDTANGTLYLVLSNANTAPSVAQVKAGQNAAGATVPSNSQAISSSGAKTASMSGLTGATTYYPFWVHTNGSSQDSAVTAGTSFTTSGGGGRLFRQAPGGQLTGIGSTGPFYANPLN